MLELYEEAIYKIKKANSDFLSYLFNKLVELSPNNK